MKAIPGFPEYSITKEGRIWSDITHQWLNLAISSNGYPTVILFNREQHKKKQFSIHQLVLSAFVGLCPVGKECRHLNSVRTDNRLCNLEWGTRKENHHDAILLGTHQGLKNKGENHPQAKLDNEDIRDIRRMSHDGISDWLIGRAFGVCRTIINRIKNRKHWQQVA